VISNSGSSNQLGSPANPLPRPPVLAILASILPTCDPSDGDRCRERTLSGVVRISDIKSRRSSIVKSQAEQRRTPLTREARRIPPSNPARSTPIPTR
jgi:hypothetical protein